MIGFELGKREDKVILIDWGYYLHASIFATKRNQIPATYTACNMLLADLKKVGCNENDIIIVCIDARNNWRKKIDPSYKANRKEKKKQDDIDWKFWYKKFDEMIDHLDYVTPFHYLKIDTLEADDIIAYACRYFKNKECVIISCDSDYEQLFALHNVKLYSPKAKKYKLPPPNPYKLIAKKIKKESSDNLVSEVLTEEDYQKRVMLVSLLTLPDFVEEKIKPVLDDLNFIKTYNMEEFCFVSLRSRLLNLYDQKGKITMYDSIKKKKRGKNGRSQRSSSEGITKRKNA